MSSLPFIEHRVRTTGWLPDCVLSEGWGCAECPVGDLQPCPIGSDVDYRSYLLWLRDKYVAYSKLRTQRIETLQSILARHKQPLHWQVLAKIALEQAQDLFGSEHSVTQTLYSTVLVFKLEGEGVFGLTAWQGTEPP